MTDSNDSAPLVRGLGVVLDACAEAFLNEPTSQVVSDMRRVANVLGAPGFDDIEADDGLKQRYYDRMFVTSSPLYVPLREGSIVGGGVDQNGAMRYAGIESGRADHVLRCYRAVGFDHRALVGYPLAISTLKPDSIASELAFLAFCVQRCAKANEAGQRDEAARWIELAQTFARDHACTWIPAAAACLERTYRDFYARVCTLAAQAVHAVLDEALRKPS
ncbi:molecular chaperone TorD family protein [Gordonibacter sp. An230]|uniref:molecular chaperone TorD family protein n=1 Tax=Gordonibacter sp. An230 TaxID=1965592 RepID=UPI0013A64D52|nr:molecular chaperone TorD family protein [Gordonibacter sp. An230]